MKKDGELWRRSRLRQVKYLNNIVEQDHRRVKRLTGPGLGFGGFRTARRTLAGYEAMAMIKKGQICNIIRARQSSSLDYSRWPPETSSYPFADSNPTNAILQQNRR
jgi:DDE domain